MNNNNTTTNNQQYRTRVNKHIRVPQVRVILSDGSNGGIMNTQDALKLAQNEGLDLIEVNPRGNPPVCKIADHSKLLYEEKKKQQAAKKNQQNQELKEILIRPGTDTNDISHKLVQAKEFLQEGHRIKINCKFRGREITHPEVGKQKLEYCLEQLKDLIQPNPQMSFEGKIMFVLVQPIKK